MTNEKIPRIQINEFACKEVVFHFNKAHLTDQTIPMWVLKFHGETFYVNHVNAMLPWTTKETPDNPHTKGSLKFKDALVIIDANNEATLTKLTIRDKFRLRNQKISATRIMFRPDSDLHKALKKREFQHSKFKTIEGACSTEFVVCDILEKEEMTMLALKHANEFRILMPNEHYYQAYDGTNKYIQADYSDEDTPYEYS